MSMSPSDLSNRKAVERHCPTNLHGLRGLEPDDDDAAASPEGYGAAEGAWGGHSRGRRVPVQYSSSPQARQPAKASLAERYGPSPDGSS
jgi:hypothetical protein